MFFSSASSKNRANNGQLLTLLRERAKKLPHPLAYPMFAFSAAAHAVIEEIWDPAKNVPKSFSERVGELSSEQFFRLYHATIWSFSTLYSFELDEEDADILEKGCSAFVGSVEKEPMFAENLARVIAARGTAEFLSMKLYAHFRSVLKLTANRDPGIPFLVLFTAAYSQATLRIHEERTDRLIRERFPEEPSA